MPITKKAIRLSSLIKPKTKTMKKLLLVVAIAGFMTSCKDKKDEKKADETTTTPKMDESKMESTTTPSSGVPSFSDPEVQKFANDYAAFIANYKAGMKDPSKMADLAKNMQEWTTKSQSIAMKLAQTPDEAKKWADWATAMSKELMSSMQVPK